MKKKEWLNNLMRNLEKERKRLNLSQQAVAEKAKLSISTIAKIEQGNMENPTFDTIEALGIALKKSEPLDLLLRK